MTTRRGSCGANMDRAVSMFDAWPRFHELSLSTTNSTRMEPKQRRPSSARSLCAALPRVTTTLSMPATCSPSSRWTITDVPSTRMSCFGFAYESSVDRRAAAGTSACRTRGARRADIGGELAGVGCCSGVGCSGVGCSGVG